VQRRRLPGGFSQGITTETGKTMSNTDKESCTAQADRRGKAYGKKAIALRNERNRNTEERTLAKQKHSVRLKKFLAVCGLAGILTLSFAGCGKIVDMLDHASRDILSDDINLQAIFSSGNLEIVKEYLDDGVDVNCAIRGAGKGKVFPLYVAAVDSFGGPPMRIIEYLLEQGADPNSTFSKGKTLLMWTSGAVNTYTERTFEELTLAKKLIEYGADLNRESEDELTALDYAVMNRYEASVKLLLESGAKVSEKTMEASQANDFDVPYNDRIAKLIFEAAHMRGIAYNRNPLLEAAILGSSDSVIELFAQNGTGEYGHRIPFYVAAYCNVEALRSLEAKGLDLNAVDENGCGLLTMAAGNGNMQMVRYLIERGAEINLPGLGERYEAGPLGAAILNNQYDMVAFLLSQGARFCIPEEWGGYADYPLNELEAATVNGNEKLLQLMREYGYPLNMENMYYASLRAIKYDQLNILQYFLMNGLDVNFNLDNPGVDDSIAAAAAGSGFMTLEATKILYENGAVFSTSGILDSVCAYGDLEIVEYLLGIGMNPDDQTKYSDGGIGTLPIENAVVYGYFDIVKRLVESGAKITDPIRNWDSGQDTILIIAAGYGYRILQYLIGQGAIVDYQGGNGHTALMNAVKQQNVKCVKILLDAGADTSLKNNDGQTAYDMAKETNNRDLIKLFEKSRE
jgi:ankyrin repeat protein